MPEDIIGSLSGYVANTGATFGLRCLKDAELLSLDFQSLRAAAQADLELANELLNLVLRFAIKKENRKFEFCACLRNKGMFDCAIHHHRYLNMPAKKKLPVF